MQELFVRVRRVGLMVAGAGSGVLGLVVAWATVQPGVIGSVETAGLVAIFGLLVLPTVVYVAWAIDSKAAIRARARERTRLALEAEQRGAALSSGLSRSAGLTMGTGSHVPTEMVPGMASGLGSGLGSGVMVPVAHAPETRRAPSRRAPARASVASEA